MVQIPSKFQMPCKHEHVTYQEWCHIRWHKNRCKCYGICYYRCKYTLSFQLLVKVLDTFSLQWIKLKIVKKNAITILTRLNWIQKNQLSYFRNMADCCSNARLWDTLAACCRSVCIQGNNQNGMWLRILRHHWGDTWSNRFPHEMAMYTVRLKQSWSEYYSLVKFREFKKLSETRFQDYLPFTVTVNEHRAMFPLLSRA